MRQRIAPVTHNQLMPIGGALQDTAAIPVGSAAWYAWLTDPHNQAFSLTNHLGTFTARCERQHNSWYWYLYSKRAGKLSKAYLGKAEALTPERLDTVATTLVRRQDVQAEPASRAETSTLPSSTARDAVAAAAG